MLDLTNRILNTAGLTGGAQCSAATERKDGHGGVSSLLLMVDFSKYRKTGRGCDVLLHTSKCALRLHLILKVVFL